MIDINQDNISSYVARFLAGETDSAEERALYDYFSHGRVPAEFECYREMFAWYGSLGGSAQSARPAGLLRFRRWRWQWTGVAATVALLLGLGFMFRAQTESLPEEYMAYEGSYIIRNGKKITDLRVVVPEIRRNEKLVSERLQQLDMSFDEAEDAFDRAFMEEFEMSDPEVAEVVQASLRY
ncbi:MAG: hypothetical protein K2F88_05685 [Duncaniella sp.]|nr:hypothetical protein [Duncaniella sp.]